MAMNGPEILLVEDDPTTRSYLQAITEALPARVVGAGTLAQARELAHAQRFDLWLVDANLPDGDGATLLARLRADGLEAPALAHTAARDRDTLDALLRAGFVEALVKPIEPGAWRAAIGRALGERVGEAPQVRRHVDAAALPVWDDALATRALGGNPAHVATLRGLFLAELPAQVEAIRAGGEAVRDQLHRLRASCALVGAARLDAAVQALQAAPESEAVRQRFFDEAREALLTKPG
jgi:CheY-like chemotaxis protein/HPt (histidine-containing phosphotransfer) domain-containing protein